VGATHEIFPQGFPPFLPIISWYLAGGTVE
jgi:hypothetical protein